ncbi:hypothetical protein N9T11_00930 [Candidatus Pelagibacter sp.]|nr:hypothetical protein [Candidatus Pelagibacter sp.]MDA9658341.1 hypothetical protein [Candidatus Pelagibacter sp.]
MNLDNLVFILFLIQVVGSFVILHKRNYLSHNLGLIDKPNSRKIHKVPTPKIGSLLMFLSWFTISIVIFYISSFTLQQKIVFIFSSLLIIFLGYIDDKFVLSGKSKIFPLIFIISFLILQFPDYFLINNFYLTEQRIIDIKKIGFIFSIFCLITIIIAVDLFDGINLICCIFFISKFLLFLLLIDLNAEFEFINKSFLIVLIIFSFFNIYGKAFLSSGGTYLLSFYLGLELIYISNILNEINALQIFSLLFLPGVDMVRVFFLRLFKTGKVFTADKSHFHHILNKRYDKNIVILIISTYIIGFDILNLFELLEIFKILFIQTAIYILFLLFSLRSLK